MKRSVSRQLISTQSPIGSPVESTVTCAICQAVYAPSRLHAYLLQAPPIALESAFMSMCHFCFRCRRPSCPNCWDNVHGVCGQCAQETHVPFRVETPPLEGTSYSSPRSRLSTQNSSTPPSLVSVQPGRFQETLPSFNTPAPDRPNHYHSSNLQPPFPVQSAGTIVALPSVDVDKIETRPDRSKTPDIDNIQTRPDRSKTPDIDNIQTRPDRSKTSDIDNIQTRPDTSRALNIDHQETHPFPLISKKKKPLRLFTSLIFILALLIVAMIVTSWLLVDVNMFIYGALHINIRAGLISLWSFLHSLFS